MRLQNTQNRLYTTKNDGGKGSVQKEHKDVFDPRINQQLGNSAGVDDDPKLADVDDEEIEWVLNAGTTQRQKTLLLLAGFVLLAGLIFSGGGYLIYRWVKKDFKQQRVFLEVAVSPSVDPNEDTTIAISYANDNPVALEKAQLTVNAPSSFLVTGSDPPQAGSAPRLSDGQAGGAGATWELGELEPRERGVLKLQGRFLGAESDAALFKSVLAYLPGNLDARFQNEAEASTKITTKPIALFVYSTNSVASGYAVAYKIKVRNNGEEPLQKMKVSLDFPPGFTLSNSSEPLTGSQKDIWSLPALGSGEEVALNVDGQLEGYLGDQKQLTVAVGESDSRGITKEYVRKTAKTEIVKPPVAISQEIKNLQPYFRKGEDVSFTVSYENISDRPIGQAVVKAKLGGAIFDRRNVTVDNGGWYDSNNNEIVWQGGKSPGLAVINMGDKGELNFSLKVADPLPPASGPGGSAVSRVETSIGSDEMPADIAENKIIAGNTIEFKAGVDGSVAYGSLPSRGTVAFADRSGLAASGSRAVETALLGETGRSAGEAIARRGETATDLGNFSRTDILALLRKKVDLISFLGKPVRIKLPSDNPDRVPGGDTDYLYIYPPQVAYEESTKGYTVEPLKTMYLASGKNIRAQRKVYIENVLQNNLNRALADKGRLVEELRLALNKQVASRPALPLVKPTSSADPLWLNEAQAENLLTSGQLGNNSEALLLQLINSGDSSVQQALALLLLALTYNDVIAQAATLDKTDCLDQGGQWINEQCQLDQSQTYQDSGSGVDEDERQAACEGSGGEWDLFSSSRSVCLRTCGYENEDCRGSKLADFEDAYGLIIADNKEVPGCRCAGGECVDAGGECVSEETENDDEDGDDVSDGKDVCPGTDEGDSVNTKLGSGTVGCSCSQLKKKGALRQRTCPQSSCDGPYRVQYPNSGTDLCEDGVIEEYSCSPINRVYDQTCQSATQQQQPQQQQQQ